MPKRKSTSIIIGNATDGPNTEPVVEPVISPVASVLSNATSSAATLSSFVEDTTTIITLTGSVTSAKQNDARTKSNDEEMSAESTAPPAPSFASTVSNTPSFTTNDDESSLVVIEEEEVVEEVAVSQQSQESWILSPTNSISANNEASPMEASSDAAPDFADDPGEESRNALCEGALVRIKSNGKYKGKVGTVGRMTEKMVYVTIEGIGKDPRISKANVEVVGEEQPTHAIQSNSTPPVNTSTSTKTANNTESSESPPSFEVGQAIRVINENSDYYGEKGAIVKVNKKMLRVSIDGVGEKSLSNGDLDGDRYFILWDRTILLQLKTDPIVEKAIVKEENGNEKNDKKTNHNWLKEAQQLMVDSASVQDLGALTGCLYKLAEQTADASNLYLRDPDAVAFANAYNQALEYGKHGGKINLPMHLHAEVPARLRKHLSNSK